MTRKFLLGEADAQGKIRSLIGSDSLVYVDGRFGYSRTLYVLRAKGKGTHYAPFEGMNEPSQDKWRKL